MNQFTTRKDESKKFRNFRFVVCATFLFGYITYLAYLIYELATDTPNLKVERNFLEEVDVPDILICGSSNDLLILSCDFEFKNQPRQQIDRCSNYINPKFTSFGRHREFCLSFSMTNNKTIKYAHPNSDKDGLSKIRFYFYENSTAAEATNVGIASLTIQLTSPDFDPLTNPDKIKSEMDRATASELNLQWNFIAGMSGYVALVKFKTSEYRSILPGDISAIFGLQPHYHSTPKIESLTNYFPFNQAPYELPDNTTGYFSVAAGSFIRERITEERQSTILGVLGAAGGALGILGGATVLLFGEAPVNPWGYAHKFFKQKDTYDELFEDKDLTKLPPEARSEILEKDISKIKKVIKSYLLDA